MIAPRPMLHLAAWGVILTQQPTLTIPVLRPILIRILIIAMAITIVAILFWLNPAEYVFMPKCPFKLLTGFDCPGCGFQRATHALLHGRIFEAWHYNLFMIYSIPYLICVVLTEFVWTGMRQQKWRKIFEGKIALTLYIVLFFAWGIVRNIVGL